MQQPYHYSDMPPHEPKPRPRRKKRRGRFRRFVRGYLMFVGALTTLYVLVQLLVLLLIELGKWMPAQTLF